MRRFWQRSVTLVALYAVALHVILLGFLPVNSAASAALDPFAIICQTTGPAAAPGKPPPGTLKYLPGRAIDYCNFCASVAPPPPPDLAFHIDFRMARVLHVLRPIATRVQTGLTFDPKLIRGPPLAYV